MAKKAGRRADAPRKPVKQRARAFAFEGLPEKDRFGIFDPALRGFFVLAVMFAVVFGVGWTLEGTRGSSAGFAAAAVIAAGVVAGGYVGYRKIWRKPAEREMLLAMAKEEEESRAARARRALAAQAPNEPRPPRDGERSHE